jgi:hypothetical protein
MRAIKVSRTHEHATLLPRVPTIPDPTAISARVQEQGVTVSIDLGSTQTGAPAPLDLEELLATRLLVQGNSGSGKSHLLRRLLEQSAPWVQQAVIDPEGDFVTLAERFGHVIVDAAAHTAGEIQHIASRVRQHRVSVILNLEGVEVEAQLRHAASFLGGLFEADRDVWYPMLVVVDEAQLFAPAAAGGDVTDEARKQSLGAMTNLMCRGRKRGLAGVIATQRLAKLAKNVAAEASNFLMGRTFLDIDMARAADLLGMERRQAEMFRDLERGQFVALGPALARRPLPVRIGAVETSARSGSPGLLPLPDTRTEDARDLVLKQTEPAPMQTPPRQRPSFEPGEVKPSPVRIEPKPANAGGPETERALDEILRQIVAEPDAAFRSIPVLYQDFLVRCRIHRLQGDALSLPAFRRRLAIARAGVDEATADSSEWEQATALASRLPEDMQGIFLMLARAALENAPAPSDAVIAHACGSHSPRRARRVLAFLEEQGAVGIRQLPGGWRAITLPGLGWETTAADPNAAQELVAPAADQGSDAD